MIASRASATSALFDCLDRIGAIARTPQPDVGVTYAQKLVAADSSVRWDASAADVANRIRALNSRQPAFCTVEGERVRLLFAEAMSGGADAPGTVVALDRSGLVVACGVGRVRVTRLSLSRGSGKPMDVASLLNGYPDLIRPGQVLGSPT